MATTAITVMILLLEFCAQLNRNFAPHQLNWKWRRLTAKMQGCKLHFADRLREQLWAGSAEAAQKNNNGRTVFRAAADTGRQTPRNDANGL